MGRIRKYTPPVPGQTRRRTRRDLDAQISSTLFDNFDRFEHLFSTHWKTFCWGGAALVLLAAAWGVFEFVSIRSGNAEIERLNSAVTMPELVAALADYDGGDVRGNDARLRLASLCFIAGNYDDALAQLDAVLATDCPAEQRAQVCLNRAYLLERSGRSADAAAAFAAIVAADSDPAMAVISAQAGFNAGRLYLALGKREQAVEMLERVASGYDAAAALSGLQEAFWRQQSRAVLNTL
ncbi:MAG: tetratricopeptide repeat protein [Victivallaceae bacterium]|nr:tetratricopeptide repeat protein [Victivallaceae bacterium]